jgi:nucleolar complex protein 2
LTMKTVDSYREVYSWKAINCLELWGRVVAAHASQQALRPLIYPVVQLLLAAARLVPSPRWFPVRLRLARILNAVAAATGVYVPVAPLLLEVLTWPGFSKAVTGSGKCPDLLRQLRLSKANLKLASVQQELMEQVCTPSDTSLKASGDILRPDACMSGLRTTVFWLQTMELLAGSLALSARNPGFPELSHLPTLALKRFLKASPVERFRSQATLLLHAVDSNVKLVGQRRDGVDFAPKDIAAVAAFLRYIPRS